MFCEYVGDVECYVVVVQYFDGGCVQWLFLWYVWMFVELVYVVGGFVGGYGVDVGDVE